jgi:hypothetical protein
VGQPEGRTDPALPIARPVLFTQSARAEVIAAQDWYEQRAPGLGARFIGELDLTVQRIAENPCNSLLCFVTCAAPSYGDFRTLYYFVSSRTPKR